MVSWWVQVCRLIALDSTVRRADAPTGRQSDRQTEKQNHIQSYHSHLGMLKDRPNIWCLRFIHVRYQDCNIKYSMFRRHQRQQLLYQVGCIFHCIPIPHIMVCYSPICCPYVHGDKSRYDLPNYQIVRYFPNISPFLLVDTSNLKLLIPISVSHSTAVTAGPKMISPWCLFQVAFPLFSNDFPHYC